MRLQRGDRFERFVIKDALGAGPRGELYRAADEKLARDVALRLFVGDAPILPLVAAATAAASLDHPNVAAMYDVGRSGDTHYSVREYVRGASLRVRIASKSLTLETCGQWMGMIASAIGAGHSLGLKHGALTENAIVVSEDDVVKVLDFPGLLSAVDPSAETVPAASVLATAREDVRAWGEIALELLASTSERGKAFDALRRIASEARAADESTGSASMANVLAELDQCASESGSSAGANWSSGARLGTVAGAALLVAVGVGLVARDHERVIALRDSGVDAAITAVSEESRMSENPQATGAYRAGMQAARDGALDAALASLDRAVSLDPSFAAAQLRRAILDVVTDPNVRASYQTAARLRADLGSHDRTLLDAYEPATHAVPDLKASEARLEAALERKPHDADFAYNLARVRHLAGDFSGVAQACDRVLEEDPAFVGAIQLKGYVLLTSGDVDGGVAALDACLARSAVATSCLAHLLDVAVNEGRCDEAMAKARRLIALDPDQAAWYRTLGGALYSAGESLDAVRIALASGWARIPVRDRANTERGDQANLALVSGDFDLADAKLAEIDSALEAEPSEYAHYVATSARLRIALERDRPNEAAALANRYLDQHAAWTPFELFDTSIVALEALYVAGRLPRAKFIAQRDSWEQAENSHPKRSRAFSPAQRWAIGFAAGVRTADDARDALGHLPPTLPGPNARDLVLDEAIGRMHLAAGDAAEALPFLRRAAQSCAGLEEPSNPIVRIHAKYELGTALEASGDTPAACEQYALVTRSWPRAASTTARAAAERASALGCARWAASQGR